MKKKEKGRNELMVRDPMSQAAAITAKMVEPEATVVALVDAGRAANQEVSHPTGPERDLRP